MRHPLLIGTACFCGAAIAWGVNIPLTSILFHTFDPFFLAVLRIALATLVLGVIVALSRGGGLAGLRVPIGWRRHALLSLSMAGFFLFYNIGLKYTHPITAAAIMAATPVYTAVTLRWFARAPLESGFWGAALLTVIGTGVAIHGRSSEGLQAMTWQGGEPLILFSYLCWNLYSIYAQRWFEPAVSQVRRTYVVMLGTVFWLSLAWLVIHQAGLVGAPNLSPGPQAIFYLLLTAIFASALSVVAWNTAVSLIGLAAGSVWQNMVPVFAVVASLGFGIVPTTGQIIGGGLVIAGVVYMQWRRNRDATPLPTAIAADRS